MICDSVSRLAVALALQDTLSNLFAGFHILASHQIKIGDYIKLESGEEGFVTDINLRTTQIKMLANNVVLVPNEKITKAIVTNYNLPDAEIGITMQIGVHYQSNLDTVERVTIEVARDVMRTVPGGVPEYEPVVRYHTFGQSRIEFTLVLRVKTFADQYLIKHECIKRLQQRYAQEQIIIPYPIRTIECVSHSK